MVRYTRVSERYMIIHVIYRRSIIRVHHDRSGFEMGILPSLHIGLIHHFSGCKQEEN